jgi:hypothetical protein
VEARTVREVADLYQKLRDAGVVLAHTRKFPRHQRFVMAKRIEEAALSFHDQLVKIESPCQTSL